MTDQKRESVTVRIAGEEHTIRSNAEPAYTTRCAAHVDQRIHEIKKQAGLLEVNGSHLAQVGSNIRVSHRAEVRVLRCHFAQASRNSSSKGMICSYASSRT